MSRKNKEGLSKEDDCESQDLCRTLCAERTSFREEGDFVMKGAETMQIKAEEPSHKQDEVLQDLMLLDDQLADLLADEELRIAIVCLGKVRVRNKKKRPSKARNGQLATPTLKPGLSSSNAENSFISVKTVITTDHLFAPLSVLGTLHPEKAAFAIERSGPVKTRETMS